MPQCKRCGQEIMWRQPYVKGDRPLDPDTNAPHDCPEWNKDAGGSSGGGTNAWRSTSATVQQQQQQQTKAAAQEQQPQPSGPSRYESSYLIPKEDWENLATNITKITSQLERLSVFYDGMMGDIESIRNIVSMSEDYRKHQHQLAKAEEQYDQDREDGTLGLA